MNYDYVFIIHRLYDGENIKKGGVDLIMDYLANKDARILLIEFPLNYKFSNQIRVSRIANLKQTFLSISRMPLRVSFINWIIEFFLTFTTIFRYGATGGVLVTGDPLTSLPAVMFRKAGMFKFHYFHTVDYSSERFKNKFLNSIYKKILVVSLKNADLVGFVSHSATDLLTQYGVKRTIFLPNSMDFHALDVYRRPTSSRKKNSLVLTCAEISHKYLVKELLFIVKKLKSQYPDVLFNVIGRFDPTTPYCADLLNYVQENDLTSNVIFHGQIDREVNYTILGSSCIGLAFYDGLHSHVKFGDALKIREYSALGLPTVADSHTYTAVEMNDVHAGFTVSDMDEAYAKIRELFNDQNLYIHLSENALKWSKKNDKRKLLDNLYTNYLNK